MTNKEYIFNFVAKGIDSLIDGLGRATDKVKDAGKAVKKLKGDFSGLYATQRKEGKSVFEALGTSIKQATTQAGGLFKILKLISRIGAGGILVFLADKALQTNMGGIADAYGKLSAAIGEMMSKLHIAIEEVMKAMSPGLEKVVMVITKIFLDFLKALTWVIEQIIEAPVAIKVLIGGLTALGLAMWAISANPFFATVGAIVVVVWALYRGIKAIVDLFKGNSNLSMNADINVGGESYRVLGGGGTNHNNNSINHVQNNVYLEGTGSGVNDAKVISNELSLLSSISKTV